MTLIFKCPWAERWAKLREIAGDPKAGIPSMRHPLHPEYFAYELSLTAEISIPDTGEIDTAVFTVEFREPVVDPPQQPGFHSYVDPSVSTWEGES